MHVVDKKILKRSTALALTYALSFGVFIPNAFAQSEDACVGADCDTDKASAGADEAHSAIVVTGSRISSPNLQSVVPITSIGGEQFFEQGNTNVGDALNDLPQLRSTFAQQNPGLGIGIAGLNLLDLRGLGTQRTLVLVNGRRHVPADILNNAVSPDINSIPNDLIERVDIVTGSNSALYGSDAIAGVVNFILRRDYDGLQVRGQTGISPKGFGGSQYVSAMFGKNFADGRANLTLHGEYSHQDRVFASDIPWYRSNDGLGVIDLDTSGLPNSSDGFPDRAFFRDFRTASINRYGLIPITQRTGNPVCGQGLVATNGAPATTVGTSVGNSFNCTYIFQPDGGLVAQTGTRFGSGIIGSIVGGNGQSGREENLLSVYPEQQRYNFNLLGHYEVANGIEAFVEAKYSHVDALGNNAGPSFIQGTQTQFDVRERPRLDNPFLTAAQKTQLSNLILASDCNTSLTAACATAGNLTAAQRAQITAGTYRFVLSRSLLDVGIRDEDFSRDTYRVVAGLRGTFNDDWSFELSANYGKFKETINTDGYIDKQRFMLAMDAGRNPANGQIQCRAKFDPASAIILQRSLTAEQTATLQSRLAADIASCVPYNPFGAADNSASVAYFSSPGTSKSSLDQLDILGFVSGDSSQLFELPGGPVRFALGGEYRREQASYGQDPYLQTGLTNNVVIPTFAPDPFEVKEVFGEVQLPILANMPFAENLTLNAAGRISDYKGGIGTTYTYNAGITYSPIPDILFRANYGRAVRAPNVSETAFPLVPNFNTISDPCNPTNINSNANRAANCQADLGAQLPNLLSSTYSLPIVSGSNPNLTSEKSDSYTVGAVLRPRFVPGLSLTVDYYKIDVKGIIASLTAQQILNSCYDLPSTSNVFCQQFTRFRGPGTGPFGENPGAILGNSLIVAPLNYARRVREGIDTQLTYKTTIAQDVKLGFDLIYTHNLKISNFQDPTQPTYENRILEELGDPKDEFRLDVNVGTGPFTFGYRMHYIGPMYVNTYEDFNALQGRPAENLDYADVQKYKQVFYHDIRFDIDLEQAGIAKGFKFYVGVDNVLDKHPPLGSTATGAGSAIYDVFGRYLYAGVRVRY